MFESLLVSGSLVSAAERPWVTHYTRLTKRPTFQLSENTARGNCNQKEVPTNAEKNYNKAAAGGIFERVQTDSEAALPRLDLETTSKMVASQWVGPACPCTACLPSSKENVKSRPTLKEKERL